MHATTSLKQKAAEHAVSFVEDGMVVGLGVGSTAVFAVEKIGKLIRSSQLSGVLGIPCSHAVQQHALQLGIPLTTLEKNPQIDLTIDGADEADRSLNLIKGGGGALLREKIVAQASRREIIVVDHTKVSDRLGTNWVLPIEVLPFGWGTHMIFLESLGGTPKLRSDKDGNPYLTDQKNYIVDCDFGPIENPSQLAEQLNSRTGIVDHGLFLDLATDLIIASNEDLVHLTRDKD